MNNNLAVKLQLHDAIYRLRFYSNSLIHMLSLSNSHNDVTSIQKNRGDKSHRVIVALVWLLKYSLCAIRITLTTPMSSFGCLLLSSISTSTNLLTLRGKRELSNPTSVRFSVKIRIPYVSASSKAAITRWDLSLRFFCIDATLWCEFESDNI